MSARILSAWGQEIARINTQSNTEVQTGQLDTEVQKSPSDTEVQKAGA